MTCITIQGFSKVLSVVVVLAMMTCSARAETDSEPTYVPDGTWLAIGTVRTPLGDVKVPFMDVYASLQNQHGWKGTVICTLALPLNPQPLGSDGALISVTATQTGPGNWTRVQKNV
jgi:hypothetical protein